MIAVYAIIFRILSGEKYNPASKEDTKLWLSFFAAVPPGIGITYFWTTISSGWSVFLIWLSATLGSVSF
jgi:hypothetical protein